MAFVYVAEPICEVLVDSGHLSCEREYHIVLLGGLDCPTHFPATDTTHGSFLVLFLCNRSALCASGGFASKAIKLTPLQFDFLFGILLFQENLNL